MRTYRGGSEAAQQTSVQQTVPHGSNRSRQPVALSTRASRALLDRRSRELARRGSSRTGSSGATRSRPLSVNDFDACGRRSSSSIFGLAGAVTQGSNVSEAVGRGLIGGVTLPATGVIVALLAGAGLWPSVSHRLPIATAFTVTANLGVGLALGGTHVWGRHHKSVPSRYWLPVVGGGFAYAIASVLPRSDAPEKATIPTLAALVGVVLANVEFAFLGSGGGPGSLTSLGQRLLGIDGVVATVVLSGTVAAVVWAAVYRASATTRRADSDTSSLRSVLSSRSPPVGVRWVSQSARWFHC